MDNKTVHISLRIDSAVLSKIDETIKGTALTRSSYINLLLKAILK